MPKSVLVVDDAAFMRMMLRDILSKEGYVVREAVNGAAAVRTFAEDRPDVVTLDITMPEMGGLEALRQIRATDPAARVIIVSAMGQQQIMRDALDAGAQDFIVKPFQPAKVLEAVRKSLQPPSR
jgi:two-component system chemotaxis response regulator CheY